MPKQLTAVERMRVAEACGEGHMFWAPQHKGQYWVALIAKTAQLIKSKPMHEPDRDWKWRKFGEAVAANDVSAIEALLLELLENKDG